mmetsp:Transcript_16169/g.34968  ORF Transcript_16169/g.34968 Transcript_16169/m.34968 type:complete len:93 (-) Transcript_16169:235-513(-)
MHLVMITQIVRRQSFSIFIFLDEREREREVSCVLVKQNSLSDIYPRFSNDNKIHIERKERKKDSVIYTLISIEPQNGVTKSRYTKATTITTP